MGKKRSAKAAFADPNKKHSVQKLAKPMADRKFDYFVSHCQASGQDQCGKLHALLTMRGAEDWYDMQVQDLTAGGMEEGVADSRNFLLFLSHDYMGRPFCLKELRWAILYDCKIVGVVEKDARHGAADFDREAKLAPADLKHIFAEVEFIEFHRREPFQASGD